MVDFSFLKNINVIIVGLIYLVVVATHLFACLKKFKKIQKTSKWFLMPLLALFYFLAAPVPNPMIIVALLCGWLGDIMSLPLPGAVPFGIGHILYCIAIIKVIDFSSLKIYHILFPSLAFVILMTFLFKNLRQHLTNTSMIIVVIGYMLLISIMGVSVILLLFSSLSTGTLSLANILMVIGGILFVLSDAILSEELFIPNTDTKDFPVMSTYISAQTLLALGFILLNN